ncbi:amidase [Rhodococcus erythropolis]|uniref:amidase n=1 Tax=Rhodococcus erythropolis TaxID=1833 RepID=UPI0022268847|nr:amidase [Rhodococcus erythropolis]MCW2298001.1 amidase [Rhodococcus erythropolis]
MTDLHQLSAVELAAVIAAKQVSIPEVARYFVDRATTSDDVGAFTTIAGEHAIELAEQAQRRLDERDAGPLPRLFGVPTAIKDLDATRGIRTTFGSALFRDFVPDADDEIVEAIREGGLIDIGKTTVPEFGAACYTEPEVAPPARSPFDRTRSAAGSSGGAAAAVGAGLVPFAQGSDTAGSLRSPASTCGVVGLKPSRGLITMGVAGHDNFGFASKGPIARTVRDTAALLDVLATRPGAGTIHPPRPKSFEEFVVQAEGSHSRPLTVALAHGSVSGGTVDPRVSEAVSRVGVVLESLGHNVFERPQVRDDAFVDAFTTMFSSLAGTKPIPEEYEHLLRPIVQHLRVRANEVPSGDLAAAIGVVQAWARRWSLDYADADLVVTPTVTTPPLAVGELRNDEDPTTELIDMVAFTGNTIVANATGFPSISLPLGWTEDGVPLGVMISAKWGCDAELLSAAAMLENAMPWKDRYRFDRATVL